MSYIVDGVYPIDENPPIEVQGIATGVWGVVGTFSKGDVNKPTLVTSLNDLKNQFGGPDTSLTGYIGALTAFMQGATQCQVVRITGTGAAAASAVVKDSSNNQVFTATYPSVGAGGNSASLNVAAGTKAGTFKIVASDGDNSQTIDNVVTVLPANPTAAPAPTGTGTGGVLPAGAYQLAYSYTNSSGETLISPIANLTITAGQNIQVPALTLPGTITGVNYYMSVTAGSSTLALATSGTGAQVTITALPAAGAANPPASNTAQNGFTLVTAIKSQVANFTQPGTPNTNLPLNGTYPLAGGSNGTAPNVSAYIGTTGPNTGMQALAGATPAVNLVFLAQQADPTIEPAMQTFCSANDCMGAVCDPSGTSISTAKNDTQNFDTDRLVFCWPWQNLTISELNNTTVLAAPTGYWVGRVATLFPHQSPGNKSLVTEGPEFPVSPGDIQVAMDPANRIVPIGVPIPRGGKGIASGASLSQNSPLRPVYRRRMDDFIVQSIDKSLGAFVDEPITTQLMSDQQHTVSNFLDPLTGYNNEAGEPMIASYYVQCDAKNNPPSVQAEDMTIIDTRVQLFNMNRFLVFRTQIGAGVITTTSH